ncbi:MAG: alanine racemase [Kutzneria sp.]|nr:alanine racemase [Kutzneria sp.]
MAATTCHADRDDAAGAGDWTASPAGATAEAVVNLDAIAHNTALFTERARTAVMAVVKADGFGHGMIPVARAALDNGADWLGVTSCAEALRLREAGITAPVLSWLHAHDTDFRRVIAATVDLSAASCHHLARIAAGAAEAGMTAMVHLKVDTGLCRNGESPARWPALVALARRLEQKGLIWVRGVWSHLVNAGVPGHLRTARQVELFDQAVALARAGGLDPQVRHLANSAAGLGLPGCRYDLVRAGIGLYGVEPVHGRTFGLRAAMTLHGRVILVKRVPAGTGVSYDHRYVTTVDSTLALVPIGYADGVPRTVGGRAEVWCGGRRHPVAGSVAMDQFVVDLGTGSTRLGDEVVVFGPGSRGEPTVTEWAGWADTIPHEVFTRLGDRIPRRYVGECRTRGVQPDREGR